MAKAELKTKENEASVEAFLAKQADQVASDCRAIMRIMKRITGEEPRMWGDSMVGYGSYHYKYASGRRGIGR